MDVSILIGGFGGQGVQTLGKLLAYAGNDAGLEVTFLPSYGGEMRGGTSNCTVVLSDKRIGAPHRDNYNMVIAMNIPSFQKFEETVKAGGTLFVNSSLIPEHSARTDITEVSIPLNELVQKVDSAQSLNIIMYGFLVAYTGIIPQGVALQTLTERLGKKKEFAEMNHKAFEIGVAYAEEVKK